MALEIYSLLSKEIELLPSTSLNVAAHAKLALLSKGYHITRGAGRVHWEARMQGGEGGRFLLRVSSSSFSGWILRAMAPGAAQHFCRGDERSLGFTFPDSDRLQNYGPELLFLGIVTSPDKSMSAIVNSLLCRI